MHFSSYFHITVGFSFLLCSARPLHAMSFVVVCVCCGCWPCRACTQPRSASASRQGTGEQGDSATHRTSISMTHECCKAYLCCQSGASLGCPCCPVCFRLDSSTIGCFFCVFLCFVCFLKLVQIASAYLPSCLCMFSPSAFSFPIDGFVFAVLAK